MAMFLLPQMRAPPRSERSAHHMKPAFRPHLSDTQPAMKTLTKAPAYEMTYNISAAVTELQSNRTYLEHTRCGTD